MKKHRITFALFVHAKTLDLAKMYIFGFFVHIEDVIDFLLTKERLTDRNIHA